MSEQQRILDALKQAGAPDYMVIIITEIVGAKDAIREAQSAISVRTLDQQQQAQLLDERYAAFLKAAKDMTDFANRLYGPESELSQVNEKLAAAASRDNALEKLVSALDERVTVLEQLKSA